MAAVSRLARKEKSIKSDIKLIDAQLYKEIVHVYDELTEEKARTTIVEDKWLADISARVSDEMQVALRHIMAEINDMYSRYEFTLSELCQSYADKETLVLNHLKEMGFEL